MRKFFLFFFLLFILVKFFSNSIYAQNVGEILPTGTLLPGQDCGNPVAADTEKRRCCYFKPIRVSIQKPNILVVDQTIDLLSGWFDQYLSPVLNPLNELITSTVQPCVDSTPSTPGNVGDPSCVCIQPTISPLENIKPLCKNIDRSKSDGEYNSCRDCLSGKSGTVGVWTGLGCIYTDTKSFIQETIFGLGIGLAGGFSLLCIIYAAFMMQSSQGNPEKLKKAQEMITSCIMGLMLIIFSVFILKLIGVNILKIPGFL